MPTLAIAIFVAVFAIATFRNIHLGVLMLPAACAVGVWLAGMSLGDIVAGFPVGILVLIAGVTYLFGIAKGNGTIDRVVQSLLATVGARRGLLPFVFFLITAGVAAMGSPQAGYVVMPLAMPAARRSGVDPMLMAVAINGGISAGGLAPTSLFGIVTNSTARQAGIDLNPLTLLAAAIVANVALIAAATWLFPGSSLATAPRDSATEPAADTRTIHLTADRDAHRHRRADSLRDHRLLAGIRAGHRRDRIRLRRRTGAGVPGGGNRRPSQDRLVDHPDGRGNRHLRRGPAANGRSQSAGARGDERRDAAGGRVGDLHDRRTGLGVCVDHGDPCGACTDGRAAGRVRWRGRVGIVQRDGRVRLDCRCVTILDDRCAAHRVGRRGRTAAVEVAVDAMGTVDGDCRAGGRDPCTCCLDVSDFRPSSAACASRGTR